MSTSIGLLKNYISSNYPNASILNPIKYGENNLSRKSGCYILYLDEEISIPKICASSLVTWVSIAKSIEVNTNRIDYSKLALLHSEMIRFWLDDEQIVYIGKANCICKRVRNYYRTPLGFSRPHAGGYWIKILDDLNAINILQVESSKEEKLEIALLKFFSQNVNLKHRHLFKENECIPFANLELEKHHIKPHRIKNPFR